MKQGLTLLIGLACLLQTPISQTIAASAQPSSVITYQGRITVQGDAFDGLGYFKFTIVDSGASPAEAATGFALVENGRLGRIEILSRGRGYLEPPFITIADPTGSGASAEALLENGAVKDIRILNGGRDYSNRPQVIIDPPRVEVRQRSTWSHDGSSQEGMEPKTAVPVSVVNGRFTVRLGDPLLVNMTQPITPEIFQDGMGRLRIWFSDGIRPYVALAPDQSLDSSPRALLADGVSSGVITTSALNNNAVTSAKIQDGTVTLADLNAQVSQSFWTTQGNGGTSPETNYVGTTDNQALVFKVNGVPAMRLEPHTISPNVVGGAGQALPGVSGAAIGGGGTRFAPNVVGTSFGTIAGGVANEVHGVMTSIGGGSFNRIQFDAENSRIGGGLENTIHSSSSNAFMGGGLGNIIASNAPGNVLMGGRSNLVERFSESSTLGGGFHNRLEGDYAWLAGGLQNNLSSANYSVIGGGSANTNSQADYAVIGGGLANVILSGANASIIAGGWHNLIQAGSAQAVIPGGSFAVARNYGQWTFASGPFDPQNGGGDAQISFYVLRGTTSTNTAETELFLDGIIRRIRLPAGASTAFEMLIVYRLTEDFIVPPIPPYFPGGFSPKGSAGAIQAKGIITHFIDSNEFRFSGTPVITTYPTEQENSYVSLELNQASRALVVKANISLPARWVARVKTVEVIGP